MAFQQATRVLKGYLYQLAKEGVEHGLHPAWLGYRCVVKESIPEYFARYRKRRRTAGGSLETIHPETTLPNPLPCNVAARDELPRDRGWWGYSMWDVPSRTSRRTIRATLPNCCVVPFVHPESHEFWPAILNQDRRALDLHEMQFQPWHAQALRAGRPTTRLHRATWILERVYHNHSHWLTAHLPKLLLLQERDALGDVVLPPPSHRTAVMDSSLRMLGIDPGQCQTFDPEQLLEVDELTVAATDRFRPELLQPVREAVCVFSRAPHRKVYISRAKASRRHLDNRNEIWPLLQEAGFERVFMEDLPFDDQVALMQEASVVMAPHGAGLTNMMFCAPGTHVIEIADLGFPNPNFYALAAAMEHNYWIVPAEGVGDGHPLERDMRVSPSAIGSVLSRLPQ